MARYRNPQTGEVIEVGEPSLNPQLIAGMELVAPNTPLGISTPPSTPSAPTSTTPASIDSSIFQTTPTPNFQSPQQISTNYNLDYLFAPTPTQTQEQTLFSRAQELNRSLLGEEAYRQGQETEQGLIGFRQTERDLQSQLQGLIAERNAIPLQIQQEFQGRGVTAGGVAPIETGRLRENAIKALTTGALLEATRGNIASAQDKVEQAVRQKYGPIKEEYRVTLANLELIKSSPDYTLEQKKRAALTELTVKAKDAQLEKDKTNFEEAQKKLIDIISLNPQKIDSETMLTLRNAKNPIDVLNLAQSKGLITSKQDITAARGSIEEFKLLNNGRMPKDLAELNEFTASRNEAGRKPTEKSSGSIKPLSTIDIQRIKDLYGVTIPFGSTQKQAEDLINKSNTPEAKTRTVIQQFKDSGASYDEIIKAISDEPTINDKEMGKKIANEIYGVASSTVPVAVPSYGRGNFSQIDIADRAKQLVNIGFNSTQIRNQLISDGYERNKATQIANQQGGLFSRFINNISNYLFGE